MKFADYKATLSKHKQKREGDQGQPQDGTSESPAATLLKRYRMSVAKDVKAAKWKNLNVDLAEAAAVGAAGNFRAKPQTYYHELEDLIAQAREQESVRQEGQQQFEEGTHVHNHKAYIDEKIAYLEASVEEKLKQFDLAIDNKLEELLTRSHKHCLCKETYTSSHGLYQHGGLVLMAIGMILCFFWKPPMSKMKYADVERQLLRRSKKPERIEEDGWEDVDKDDKNRSGQVSDLRQLADKEGVKFDSRK